MNRNGWLFWLPSLAVVAFYVIICSIAVRYGANSDVWYTVLVSLPGAYLLKVNVSLGNAAKKTIVTVVFWIILVPLAAFLWVLVFTLAKPDPLSGDRHTPDQPTQQTPRRSTGHTQRPPPLDLTPLRQHLNLKNWEEVVIGPDGRFQQTLTLTGRQAQPTKLCLLGLVGGVFRVPSGSRVKVNTSGTDTDWHSVTCGRRLVVDGAVLIQAKSLIPHSYSRQQLCEVILELPKDGKSRLLTALKPPLPSGKMIQWGGLPASAAAYTLYIALPPSPSRLGTKPPDLQVFTSKMKAGKLDHTVHTAKWREHGQSWVMELHPGSPELPVPCTLGFLAVSPVEHVLVNVIGH